MFPNIETLKARGKMLRQTRAFFFERDILEVDCPAAILFPNIDAHIDPVRLPPSHYLFTSPEFGMKRLLASGAPDIYQIAHVFRKEEKSPLHNPEFTLIEWYRIGKNFDFIMQETVDLIRLFLGPLPEATYSYRNLIKAHTGLDYPLASKEDLLTFFHSKDIYPDPAFDKDSLLQQLFNRFIEPELGKEEISIVKDYPETQAALSKLEKKDGIFVAKRFEAYFQGIELANGYDELKDPLEQSKRFDLENIKRKSLGKSILAKDPRFIEALKSLPDAVGVAAGFDRLLMLKLNLSTLQEALPFSWETA